jgi:hypothetical protein
MEDPRKLRALAGWYREFAERAGNPAIWEARLRTAKDFEREADRLEKIVVRRHESSELTEITGAETRAGDGSPLEGILSRLLGEK